MRWLFWVLVLVNLVGFYWFSLSSDHRSSKNAPQQPLVVGSGSDLDETRLVLVSEIEISKLDSTKPENAKLDSSKVLVGTGAEMPIIMASTEASEDELLKAPIKNDEEIPAVLIDAVEPEPEPESEAEEVEVSLAVAAPDEIKECVLIGPLSEKNSALELKEVLISEQVTSTLYEKSSEIREDYWMIIPPLGERGEAKTLLRELQERKIDSDIIYEGEYKNGITLGVFGNAENTERYESEMKALGYPVEVKSLPRFSKVFWLELSGLNISRLSVDGFKNNGQEANEKKIAGLSALVWEKFNEQNISKKVNISEIVCGAGEAGSGLASHMEKSAE